MPTGDALAEPMTGEAIRNEAHDEKRASASAVAAHEEALQRGEQPPDSMYEHPTAQEMETLRRVAAPIPAKIFTIAFIELCERFSYYGCTVVCK